MRNDGADVFTTITQGLPNTGGNSQSVVWTDFDSDGDLDLYIGVEGNNMLIRNDTSNTNHWLHIKPVGTVSNSSAVGARIRIVIGATSQIREITSGTGFMSQEPLRASFGLGSATIVDTLSITWPSGTVQVLTGVAVDQLLVVGEAGQGSAVSKGSG